MEGQGQVRLELRQGWLGRNALGFSPLKLHLPVGQSHRSRLTRRDSKEMVGTRYKIRPSTGLSVTPGSSKTCQLFVP